MDKETFMKMFSGTLNPTNAFMAGKLSLKGDLPVAMKLNRLMSQMRSKLWSYLELSISARRVLSLRKMTHAIKTTAILSNLEIHELKPWPKLSSEL